MPKCGEERLVSPATDAQLVETLAFALVASLDAGRIRIAGAAGRERSETSNTARELLANLQRKTFVNE
jgi:hypothetical protein